MKLIIWWLTLMVILPLFYLWWRKKTWRLVLGIIILIILIVGWLLPGKMAFSILEKELKKVEEKMEKGGWRLRGKEEERKSWQKVEEALKSTLQQEITPENQEKIAVEKEIIKWREGVEKTNKEKEELGKENYEQKRKEIYARMAKGYEMSREKEWEWARKWGGKEDPPVFLFAGEEFNYELTKKRTTFKGSWQIVWDRDYHSDVIDFEEYGNANPGFVKKRVREIWDYWNSGITRGGFVDDYPIILFKNIDKITNSELKNELLKIVDFEKNDKYGKYQIKDWDGKPTGAEGNIDLSKFLLIVATATSNPQLSNGLRKKLNQVEPFLDKCSGIIFFSSLGAEIVIFFLLKKKWRKLKDKKKY